MASETTTTTTSTGAPEAHGSGLPQFELGVWPGQIVWLLLTFLVVYLVLSRTLLPRMRGALEERDGRIESDLETARKLRAEAEAQGRAAQADMAEARARAQKTAADAKARAQTESTARQGALEAELNVKLEAAEGRIRESRTAAMTQVRGVAAETAALIAERLTGQAPAPGEVDAALDALPARA